MTANATANPLGFHCAPNGTDPTYTTEYDLERFVAFGLWLSWRWLYEEEALRPEPEDLAALRAAFLDTVENAALALPGMEPDEYGTATYEGDDLPGVDVDLAPAADAPAPHPAEIYPVGPEPDTLEIRWQFVRADSDGALLFTLGAPGCDDAAVWLDRAALENDTDRARVLAKARATI